MKNKLRKVLLSGTSDNSVAIRAVEIIERYSPADLTQLMLKHFYKEAGIPYEYVNEKGLIAAVQADERLSLLNTLPESEKIIKWILDYCRAKNEFATINFDTVHIDKFLSFAAIFNPTLYDDINAMLSFEDEKQTKEFSRRSFGKPDLFKHMTVQDLEKDISMLNEDGIVLEVQKKNRTLFYNILYIKPDFTLVCHKTVKSLTERHPEWFDYSVVTKKAENYAKLTEEFPIEIKAFEEIIAGTRPHYVRTEEPDYVTPPLRTYEFTETIYCSLTAKGEEIHDSLKKELAKAIPSPYKFKRPGLLKTDLEEMRKSPLYNAEMEEMHGQQVECTVSKAFVEKMLPDCTILRCKDVAIRSISAWAPKEVIIDTLDIEIDANIHLDIIKRIHYCALKFSGTIEYIITDQGTTLALQVSHIAVMG